MKKQVSLTVMTKRRGGNGEEERGRPVKALKKKTRDELLSGTRKEPSPLADAHHRIAVACH